jgi:hypothetical protein
MLLVIPNIVYIHLLISIPVRVTIQTGTAKILITGHPIMIIIGRTLGMARGGAGKNCIVS